MHLNPSQLNTQLVSCVNETVKVVFLNINSNHFNSVKPTCNKPYFRNIFDLKLINSFFKRTVHESSIFASLYFRHQGHRKRRAKAICLPSAVRAGRGNCLDPRLQHISRKEREHRCTGIPSFLQHSHNTMRTTRQRETPGDKSSVG